MSMLRSCPRCTQALPASAAFCRRCGAAVELQSASPILADARKSKSKLSLFLTAMLLTALALGGFAVFGVWHVQSVSPGTPVVVSPQYYYPSPQPTYPAAVDSRSPVYPDREPYRDHERDHFREQRR